MRRRKHPASGSAKSKIDPFKPTIAEWLGKDPTVTAALIEQRLRSLSYRGGHTILRDYVHATRPQLKPNRAFLRMEPPPGVYNRVQESSPVRVSGAAGETPERTASKPNWLSCVQRPKRSQAQQRLFAVLDGLCLRSMLEANLRDITDTDRALSRQLAELLELVRQYGPQPVADASRKLPQLVVLAPITSPTFPVSSNRRDRHSHPSAYATDD